VVAVALLVACSPEPADPPATGQTSRAVPEPAGTLQTFDLDDAGTPRRYDVYVPPGPDQGEPRPAVVVLPGTNVSLDLMQDLTGLDALADAEGFLVVYVGAGPDGFDSKLCCGGTDHDVQVVEQVLAEVEVTWPLDRARLYATGFSAGGAMAYKLAVRAPDVFAAVAPVSGGFYPDPRAPHPEDVVPTSAPSVISFAGGADPDYDDFLGGLDRWRAGADCAEPVAEDVEGADGVQHSSAACAGDSTVEVYTVADMGHAWPGGSGDAAFGYDAAGISATDLIWAFFATRSRP